MRPIKFRGRVSDPTRRDTDQFIFGDLIHGPYAECALRIKPPGKRAVDVYQDTIAQLVGYDKNGHEIYEGDEVSLNDVFPFQAKLFSNIYGNETFIQETTS